MLDRENGLQEEEEVEEGENGAGGGAVPAQRRRFWDVFFKKKIDTASKMPAERVKNPQSQKKGYPPRASTDGPP